jgi:hypothetical protein
MAFVFLCLILATGSTAYSQPIKLYWADEFAGRIYKADPDGSNWSDHERGIIQRANTDGSGLETVVLTPEPKALALDTGAGKLYWVDATLGEIRRANLDGTSPETVQALVSFPITSLTIYETGQLIVWSEYDGLSSPTVDRVFTRPISGGTPDPIFLDFDEPPVRGLAVAENTSLVYFGFGPDLYRMTITGSSVTRLYSSGVAISAVAVDIMDADLYWADEGNNSVNRSNLLGGDIVVLETYASNVDGIAITPSAGDVFWTEERFIVRAEDDGTGQVHIVSRPSYFGVGFHDTIERFYWSDLNKLETYYADSDGANQNVFWAGGVTTGGALAIHVDRANDKVYWLVRHRAGSSRSKSVLVWSIDRHGLPPQSGCEWHDGYALHRAQPAQGHNTRLYLQQGAVGRGQSDRERSDQRRRSGGGRFYRSVCGDGNVLG